MIFRNIYIFLCVFLIGIILFLSCYKPYIYTIDSRKKGPIILLIGGTHGNEESGSVALNKLIYLHSIDKFNIRKGKLILIPNFNKPGLMVRSRFYSKIGKNYDLNRLYGKNFFVNKPLEKIIKNVDVILDFHEAWGFYKNNKGSIGSTIITNNNIKKKNIKYILKNLNREIKENYKKFIHLGKKEQIKYSLRYYVYNNYPNKKYFLIETTGQNNKQHLSVRVNQVLNFTNSIFRIYGTI